MTEVTLHPAPAWREVVLEQVRVVGLSLRREAVVTAVFFVVVTVILVSDILLGGRGFDSSELFPTFLFSFFFPFAVWRSDRRFVPAFLWTLPVDRRQLALAKVFAGLVWLIAALTAFTTWLLALGLVARVPLEHTILRVPFGVTIATYLLGSALVLGFRHPWRWLIGTAGVFFLLANLIVGIIEAIDPPEPRFLTPAAEALDAAVRTHPHLAWAIAAALALAVSLAALFAAASRHRENR